MKSPGVVIEIMEGYGIETGIYKRMRSDVPVTGWDCEGCGQRVDYDPPIAFAEAATKVETHEGSCTQVPRRC